MIYTFYSYKGGVGRSMALANVAEYYRRAGLRVVMVDWDLEAPGLEEYFWSTPEELNLVRAQVGVVDLLLEYMRVYPRLGGAETCPPSGNGSGSAVMEAFRDSLRPLAESLFPVRGPEDGAPGGGLWLLPAGMRFGEGFTVYARAVQTFDWRQFYAAYSGEQYFEWMRSQFEAFADVVLIDSRTGVTEMGGVCARQLADAVVSLCAPNHQNVEGVLRMSESFTRPEVLEMRAGRPLDLLVIPTRLDGSENDLMASFRDDFNAGTSRFIPEVLRRAGCDFYQLRIPYVPLYAYGERLAIGDAKANPDLLAAYRKLALNLALLAPEASRIRRCLAPELRREFSGLFPRVAIVGATGDDPEAARLRAILHGDGIEVWDDFPGLAAGAVALGDGAAVEAAPVEHLVLVLPRDPASWASARAEWNAARRLGVCAHLVLPPDTLPLQVPAWLEGARVYGREDTEALLTLLRSACRAVRIPCLAPPPPAGAQPREAPLEELVAALREASNTSAETPVILAGLAGVGKTTLAQMACHDDRVTAAFTGGIYWVDATADLAVQQHLQRIFAARTGRDVGTAEAEIATERVRLAVGDAPYLLVVDEPRDVEVARAIPPLGGRGCRLVVSRDRGIVRDAGVRVITVGPMTEAESVALLRGDAGSSGEETAAAPVLAELATLAHHWPIALQQLTALLRERQALGQSLVSAARELAERLRDGTPEMGAPLIARVLELLRPTIASLAPDDRARFARLVELAEAKKVMSVAPEEAWGGTPAEGKDAALRLAALSLVGVDADTGRVHLHPVILDAARQDPRMLAEFGPVPAPEETVALGPDGSTEAVVPVEGRRGGDPAWRSQTGKSLRDQRSNAHPARRWPHALAVASLLTAAVLAAVSLAPKAFRGGRAPALATFEDSLAALGSRDTPAGERRALFLALSARSNDLRGANLSGLDLSQQDLAELDLSNADLSGATLVNARFDKATLTGATLTGANLTGASLAGVDLTNAKVRAAQLGSANLRGANVTGVALDSTVTTELTILQDGTPGPYRPGEDAGTLASGPDDEAGGRQVGVIWIGNYDSARHTWEKPRLASASLQPIAKAPNQIEPREAYRVLGDMTLRKTFPANDDAYFEAVPALGWVPENSTVTVLERPVPFDRTPRGGRVQYWARVQVDTVPQFMYVFYQNRGDSDLARRVADSLRRAGYSIRLVANRPNARNTRNESVRYFRAEDARRAAQVAAMVQQVLEDNGVDGFTPQTNDRSRMAPSAALGQIEVWLPPLRQAPP